MTEGMRPRPAAVYRWYDRDGRLLYIGKAVDPVHRWSTHRAEGRWWTKLAVKRVDEWHESEQAALRAEGHAIEREEPPGNRRGLPNRISPAWLFRGGPPPLYDFGDLDPTGMGQLVERPGCEIGPPPEWA